MLRVSKRLTEIARLISANRLIDIGTDHGLLPIYALEQGIVSMAIGGDKSPLALANARANQERSIDGEKLSLICTDGLEAIPLAAGDCIVLAGIGGRLITQIIDGDAVEKCSQLITQANSDQPVLRAFLSRRGWQIEQETIIQHHKKIYITISWRRGKEHLTEKECYLGKKLADERPQLWLDWLVKERLRILRIQSSRGVLSAEQSQHLSWLVEEITLG